MTRSMRNFIALSLLLVSAGAMGGFGAGGLKSNAVPLNAATTADTNLFVDSTGSDNNTCVASGASGCSTFAGALARLPKRIKHAVTITAAAGNFTGAAIDGFTIESTGSLTIQGTMSTVTPASGSATGTIASATAGSTFSTGWGTATVTAAGWTVNDLRGVWLVITGGTGSGQAALIASNTATVATITGGWGTTPDATSTFALQRPATVINAAVTVNRWEGSTTTYGFFVHSSMAGGEAITSGYGSRLIIQQFKFTTTARNIAVYATGAAMRRNWHAAAATGIESNHNAVAWVHDSYFTGAATNCLTANGAQSVSFFAQGNVFDGVTSVLQVTSASSYAFGANYWYNATNDFILLNTPQIVSIGTLGDIFDCNSTGNAAIRNNTNSSAAGGILMSSTSISNCATGILARGPQLVSLLSVSGTGNTVAIQAEQGAKVRVSSGTTITGTNEIQVDGTNYTLATMRAASPTQVSDINYGTVVYQ